MISPNLRREALSTSDANHVDTRNCRALSIQTLFLLALLLLESGCYLHNDARAKQAESVLTQYRGFQTNSGSVFGIMLENHAKVQQSLAARQAQDADLKFKAYLSGLPSMRWSDIKTEVEGLQQKGAQKKTDLESKFAKAVAEQVAAKGQLKTAQEAQKELQDRLKMAQEEQDQWRAREELFKGLLQFYTGHASNFARADKTLLRDANKVILGRKIGTKTVGALLSPDLKKLEHFDIAGAARPYTLDFFDPRKAPGLKVQLLNLGADLAVARVARVQLDINRLKALNDCWTREKEALALQDIHLKKALQPINGYLANAAYKDEVVGVQVAAFQKAADAPARAELERSGRGFIYYLLAATYDESAIRELETQPSAIAHEYAIRLSKINEQEREALLLRGLESLNAYHQGGITSEEIANLIRTAEAAGVGVIGAGVIR